MDILLLWFVLAVLVGAFGSKRGRSGLGWFLISVVLSPVIGFIILLVIPDLFKEAKDEDARNMQTYRRNLERAEEREMQETREREIEAGQKTCPYCAEKIKKEAIVCRYCGRDV